MYYEIIRLRILRILRNLHLKKFVKDFEKKLRLYKTFLYANSTINDNLRFIKRRL